jgi:hypothetical protein
MKLHKKQKPKPLLEDFLRAIFITDVYVNDCFPESFVEGVLSAFKGSEHVNTPTIFVLYPSSIFYRLEAYERDERNYHL